MARIIVALLLTAWMTNAAAKQALTVREFNFKASDRLPLWNAGPNESSVERLALSPGSNKLVGPVGMDPEILANLHCASECRVLLYCHAYYFNATAGLCHLADQGQFETYWTGNGTAGHASYVKLYHDICTWQSWTSWATPSGATGALDVCNAVVNRTRVRQCTCPTDGASVSGWCQGMKDKTESQSSFIGWCPWSAWAKDSSEGSMVCGNWRSKYRSRKCACPTDSPPATIDATAVDNINKTWNWCNWESWTQWTDGYDREKRWFYAKNYNPGCNSRFTRRRNRECDCSTPTSATAGPDVSSESDVVYTAWCSWYYWGSWRKDCSDYNKIWRRRTRSVKDCTVNTPTSCAGSSSVDIYTTNSECSWGSWGSWKYHKHCRKNKVKWRSCKCENEENYSTYSLYIGKCYPRFDD